MGTLTGLIWVGIGAGGSSSKYDNKPLGSIKSGDILNQPRPG
jgi:hypothetical protein